MKVKEVTLRIPTDVFFAAGFEKEEKSEVKIKKELAVHLFEKKVLTFEKAAALAEMNHWDFCDLLGKEGLFWHYGIREFKEDIKELRKEDL
jgi:predicted HTH domain antitoxin